jgi:Bacterial Ig domain/Bacterial TSP3 repeat
MEAEPESSKETDVTSKMGTLSMKKSSGNQSSHSFFRRLQTLAVMVCTAACLQVISAEAAAEESVCARVKIEIVQEATLERQGFDAHMRINNGLVDMSLDNIAVTVHFADETGAAVLASSDPGNTDALFFIRVDTMENISAIDGTGSVAPGASADIHWFIVPAPGAANAVQTGTMYMVGATITYTAAGEDNTTVVAPDYIYVKPMPMLALDYFLPEWVYGDDAFTQEIEPEIPFSLGVRALNSGLGAAHNFKIDSAQPRIVENEQGLLIAFQIDGSTVNDQPVTPSLLVDFGSIDAGAAAVARWVMTCSLSGEFVDFSAQYSHADELGGELTSLIDSISTHLLIRDVLVDLPGRDAVRDFLARDGESLITVYESEGVDTEVTDQSASASLVVNGSPDIYALNVPQTAGFMYVQLPDPFNGEKEILTVVRSDGKVIPSQNVWFSKTRNGGETWSYYLHIFDANTTASYRFVVRDPVDASDPPVLQPINDITANEDDHVSFIVTASDPDGTTPTLSASTLPVYATFTDQGDGTGVFDWTPGPGQAGRYELTFYASDGEFTVNRDMVITIYSDGDSDGDGITDDEEIALGTNPFRRDSDFDGYDDNDELTMGADPLNENSQPIDTTIDLASGFNLVGIPADTTVEPDMQQWLPTLGDSTEIDKVMVYDPAAARYTAFIPESGSNPVVSLQPGAGMIVYAIADKSVTFTSRLCTAFDLQAGRHLMGFACVPDGLTAFELLQTLGSQDAISIQRYDLTTGKFQTAGFTETGQLYGENFAIIPGEGYYLYMRNSVSGFELN